MTATSTTVSTEDDIILHIIVLISILVTTLISCLIELQKPSQKHSATPRSQEKKPNNNSKQTSRMFLEKPTVIPTAEMSTSTSTTNGGAIGNPRKTKRRTSKVGTRSQATKTSKNGSSTASATHQGMTK